MPAAIRCRGLQILRATGHDATMEPQLRSIRDRGASSYARARAAGLVFLGIFASGMGAIACTSILGDFGDEVLPSTSSGASASSSSAGNGGSGGKGGEG